MNHPAMQPSRLRRQRGVIHQTKRLIMLSILAWLMVGAGAAAIAAWQPALPENMNDMLETAKADRVKPLTMGQRSESKPLKALGAATVSPAIPTPEVAPRDEQFIPILYYHHVPEDFEQQLRYLDEHGYTVIDMDEAVAGLAGKPLPDRPVVLTFDDGFADQLSAIAMLRAHRMRATFYIVNGGSASGWCIGAGRRYLDPLQPPEGCGDDYLSWDQVRELDRSGVATIGGHTLDHADLTSLDPSAQIREIVDSKREIETQLGHTIRHFAYPYGAYDDTSMAEVARAGYVSAVTTIGGTQQTHEGRYELRRLRTALVLPEASTAPNVSQR